MWWKNATYRPTTSWNKSRTRCSTLNVASVVTPLQAGFPHRDGFCTRFPQWHRTLQRGIIITNCTSLYPNIIFLQWWMSHTWAWHMWKTSTANHTEFKKTKTTCGFFFKIPTHTIMAFLFYSHYIITETQYSIEGIRMGSNSSTAILCNMTSSL